MGARRSDAGFSLLELLALVSVAALLTRVSLDWMHMQLRRATATVCADNLHTLGRALGVYLADWGDYPPHNLNPLYGQYVADPETFVCPNSDWPHNAIYDLIDEDKKSRQLGLRNIPQIQTYGYYPFFTVADGFTPWPAVKKERGVDTPLVWCINHNTYRDAQQKSVWTFLVLRIDGRVQTAVHDTQHRFFPPARF